MGIGFAQIMYLAISSSQDRNVIACIIILGIIIYLILAFLLKESGKVQFFQQGTPLLRVTEAVFVLLVIAGAFLLNMETDIKNGITMAFLLLVLYGCGRLLGGRLCAVVSLCTGFFFFLLLSTANYETDHTLDILCFLLPYLVFLLISKKLTALYLKQPFLIVISYIMLGILFALAVILNPLAAILLLGCVFALLSGKTEEKGSFATSGPMLAMILLLVSVAIITGVGFLMPDLLTLPSMELDLALKQIGASYVDAGRYLLIKYLQSGNLLYLTTQTGIFPAILFFFAGLSGYYALRKKASSITPLCLAYLGAVAYHLLFLGSKTEFYYMFYFLPLFSAYGIYNTLIPETSPSSGENPESAGPDTGVPAEDTEKKEEIPEAVPVAATPEPAPADASPEEPEKPEKPVPIFIPEAEPAPVPISASVPVSKKKEKRSAKKKQSVQLSQEPAEAVVSPSSPDMLEWTASEKYISDYQSAREKSPEPDVSAAETAPGINVSIPEISIPESNASIPEIPMPETSPLSDAVVPDIPVSEAPEPEETPDAVISMPEASADAVVPESGAGAGLDIPESGLIGAGMMEFDDQDEPGLQPVQNEPVIADPVVLTGQPEDKSGEEDPSLLSEDHLSAEESTDGRGEEIELSAEYDNDADAQLSTLLNRLEISDNIRRMNESAREDIADIIERDDTENELHEAKPAEELDYEIPEGREEEKEEAHNERLHEPLPKYVKPDFDFPIEPVSQPLLDTEEQISEYDKVPTINDLEKKWRDINEAPQAEEETTATQYSFAYSLDDVVGAVAEETLQPEKTDVMENSSETGVHSEEIIKKNGMGQRSYHKLTIR